MSHELAGKRVAFLVANLGVERIELTSPWRAVADAGGEPVLLAPEKEPVETVNHDSEPAGSLDPDHAVGDVLVEDFAALVLPGGVANPDALRLVPEAVAFVRAVAAAGKPVAAICHGPWTLVEAGVVAGKSLTSWPSLQTDISNAGGDWHDQPVLVCSAMGFDLVTSRKPADLPAFNRQLIATFATCPAAGLADPIADVGGERDLLA
jgi:protease I